MGWSNLCRQPQNHLPLNLNDFFILGDGVNAGGRSLGLGRRLFNVGLVGGLVGLTYNTPRSPSAQKCGEVLHGAS